MYDYINFCDLERYLFEEVRQRFHNSKQLNPLDLYLILWWKSPRARTRNRDKLRKKARSFKDATKKIAKSLCEAKSPERRLKILMEDWDLRLPTATAVLTVLYPKEFTVYDIRVRKQLGLDPIRESYSEAKWDSIWNSYMRFKRAVIEKTPANLSLRDKDRYLWGKSRFEDAEREWRG